MLKEDKAFFNFYVAHFHQKRSAFEFNILATWSMLLSLPPPTPRKKKKQYQRNFHQDMKIEIRQIQKPQLNLSTRYCRHGYLTSCLFSLKRIFSSPQSKSLSCFFFPLPKGSQTNLPVSAARWKMTTPKILVSTTTAVYCWGRCSRENLNRVHALQCFSFSVILSSLNFFPDEKLWSVDLSATCSLSLSRRRCHSPVTCSLFSDTFQQTNGTHPSEVHLDTEQTHDNQFDGASELAPLVNSQWDPKMKSLEEAKENALIAVQESSWAQVVADFNSIYACVMGYPETGDIGVTYIWQKTVSFFLGGGGRRGCTCWTVPFSRRVSYFWFVKHYLSE